MENISKYLENKRFIQWVFKPNNELEEWWKTFKTEYPKEKHNIQLARKVLFQLKVTNKTFSEEEKILLFSKILQQITEKQKSGKTVGFIKVFMKYAAVAILFFSIGALLFHRQDNFNPQFDLQNLAESNSGNEAKLIRPDGENILLEEKKSLIEYIGDGQVIINNNIHKPISTIKKGAPELNQLILPYGRTSKIFLPDGTKVCLNAGSRLVYPEFFSDKNREVFLVGEAFFEVEQDKNHPFIVQTTDLRINVLGTKFNISAYPFDNIIETVVTEGKVSLEQKNARLFTETTELKPNQLASFNKNSGNIKITNVETDNYTLWKDGLYKFESTDLSRVAKRLERFYDIHFQFADPLLGMIRITGKLELGENRDEIINRVALAASVRIVKKGEFIYEINQ